MKKIVLILILIIFQSCSFNNDSVYWNEHNKKNNEKKNLIEIIEKSKDITLMSLNEYKIYLDDYIKKSKYPDIKK